MIDRDEDGRPATAFFALAEPCESCGEPTYQPRIWAAEYQLWVAVDCQCSTPQAPVCPLLAPALEIAQTVHEVCQVIRMHRRTCHLCRRVVEIKPRKETRREPARDHKEAA